jgi:hypothetical protein
MLRKLFLLVTIIGFVQARAGNKIKVYFNTPVNTAVSMGVNAAYLASGSMGDTIVAYINRAKHTLDIAQYDYNQDTWNGAYANIAAAVDSAYKRGVVVRWIYDGGESNHGLASLDTGIHTLGRPSGGSGIMHDKFIIIDAYSSDPADAIVSTGSEDWSSEMMYKDYNNILFLQDSALAHAYTDEFNMMWGSSTATPNASLAKFGPAKRDLGSHTFYIDGNLVELYFSPSDNTNTHINNAIATANTDLYTGVYCFTEVANADGITAKKASGVYTLAIVDQYTQTASPTVYSTLSTSLGAGFKEYTGSYIYHNKMVIIDPSDTCSDPQVLTGSHNWTVSANSYNDENTVIIHNDTIANMYYQSFTQNFISLGGSYTAVSGCGAVTTGIVATAASATGLSVFPDPASGQVTISYALSEQQNVSLEIFNAVGQKIASLSVNEIQQPSSHSYSYVFNTAGFYFVRFATGDQVTIKKLVITGR